jgi:hypothetical protein
MSSDLQFIPTVGIAKAEIHFDKINNLTKGRT